MIELIVNKKITVDVDPPFVWDALVNPLKTKQYLFGWEVASDWKVGSKILWKGAAKGNDKIYIEGVIEKIEPCVILQYAIINSSSSYVDTPSNFIKTTYKLTHKMGKTELSVTQGDYSKVEDGERRYFEAFEVWDYILNGLKKLIEKKQ